MTENGIFGIESKDATRKKDENDDIEAADYPYETPHWETQFVKMIEQMRTIPYVVLGHLRFAAVNWIDESEPDDSSIVQKTVADQDKQANHWELVKKMLFAQAAKGIKSSEKSAKAKSSRQKTSPERQTRPVSNSVVPSNNSQPKTANQSGGFLSYFRDLKRERKQTKAKKGENQSSSEMATDKSSESSSLSSKRTKSLLRQKMNLKKILTREKGKRKERSRRFTSKQLDKKIASRRASDRRKDFLFDLNEMSKRKRFQKLNLIMSKDDGPFLTDYRFLLGIEFWANYCAVEKYQLISVCSSDFWSKEMSSFASDKQAEPGKLKPTESSEERGLLKELSQFIKGTNKPSKAPQRVISSEEKFRQPLFLFLFAVESDTIDRKASSKKLTLLFYCFSRLIPYPKLFNPNTDLKKTLHWNTMQDQLNKKLKKLYSSIVFLIGGKYPLKRQVGFEEAYEDMLLWVLDTYQAKTRYLALLNDQINWQLS